MYRIVAGTFMIQPTTCFCFRIFKQRSRITDLGRLGDYLVGVVLFQLNWLQAKLVQSPRPRRIGILGGSTSTKCTNMLTG
jgi:hypothetical protein